MAMNSPHHGASDRPILCAALMGSDSSEGDHNGGYLRGRTKTQVALRDRLPVSLRPRPTALTTAG